MTGVVLSVPRFPKPWVQLPLFGQLEQGKEVPRGAVVQMSSNAQQARAIIRLIMSQKPLPPPAHPSAADASDMTAAPDPQVFVRWGLKAEVLNTKEKPEHAIATHEKAAATASAKVAEAETRTPK